MTLKLLMKKESLQFPILLAKDDDLLNFDVFSIRINPVFSAKFSESKSANNYLNLSSKHLKEFIEFNLTSKYDQISIIAFSEVGLLVQRVLLDLPYEDVRRSVIAVFLFATPNIGVNRSIFSNSSKLIQPIEKVNYFIKNLRTDWNEKFGNNPPFSFLAIAGDMDRIAPHEISLKPFDKKFPTNNTRQSF